MRYSLEPKYRRYVHGYGFLSFARKFEYKYGKNFINTATETGINSAKKFGDKYGKKIMDTTKKEGINFAKTAGKRIVQKSADATGDLIGNKIANKITSLGNKPENDKPNEINGTDEPEEIIIRLEKRQQIIDDLRLF